MGLLYVIERRVCNMMLQNYVIEEKRGKGIQNFKIPCPAEKRLEKRFCI